MVGVGGHTCVGGGGGSGGAGGGAGAGGGGGGGANLSWNSELPDELLTAAEVGAGRRRSSADPATVGGDSDLRRYGSTEPK